MIKEVTRSAYVRTSSLEQRADGDRSVEFVISSEAVDSYGTVFRMSGWDLNRYIKNPVVLYQHRSHSDDPDNVIGISEIFIEGDELIGRVTFEDAETNPKAEKIRRKVLNGTLKMASVGARVKKAHWGDADKGEDEKLLYFTDQELIEWSIVTAGANPDALKRNEAAIEEIRNETIKQLPVQGEEVSKKRSVREAQLIINKNL